MKSKGTQITKIGEILGGKSGESSSQKYLRGKRFLEEKSEIKIPQLLKMATYFERPLEYFLGVGKNVFILSGSEIHSTAPLKPLEEVEQNMLKLGLDENFIQEQIQILKKSEDKNAK